MSPETKPEPAVLSTAGGRTRSGEDGLTAGRRGESAYSAAALAPKMPSSVVSTSRTLDDEQE